MSRRVPWLLTLPLMAAGCLAAHSVAYRMVEPEGGVGGHGYLALAPLALAIGVALGIVAALRSALAGREDGGGPSYQFALLPPLAFVLQEHIERALQGGAPALELAIEPTFLVGLALQLPFALCALVVARSLLRCAEAAVVLLRRTAPGLRPPIVRRPAFVVDAPRASALASPHAGRAPPLPV